MYWVTSNGKVKMHAVLAECMHKIYSEGHGTVGHSCSSEAGGAEQCRYDRIKPILIPLLILCVKMLSWD